MIFISVIEAKVLEVIFQDGKPMLMPKGSNFVGDVIGVKEHGLYNKMKKNYRSREEVGSYNSEGLKFEWDFSC